MADAGAVRAVLAEREAAVKARTPSGAPPIPKVPARKAPPPSPEEAKDLDLAVRRGYTNLLLKPEVMARCERLLLESEGRAFADILRVVMGAVTLQRKEGDGGSSAPLTLKFNIPRPAKAAAIDVTPNER